jgi:hypothetical protein
MLSKALARLSPKTEDQEPAEERRSLRRSQLTVMSPDGDYIPASTSASEDYSSEESESYMGKGELSSSQDSGVSDIELSEYEYDQIQSIAGHAARRAFAVVDLQSRTEYVADAGHAIADALLEVIRQCVSDSIARKSDGEEPFGESTE